MNLQHGCDPSAGYSPGNPALRPACCPIGLPWWHPPDVLTAAGWDIVVARQHRLVRSAWVLAGRPMDNTTFLIRAKMLRVVSGLFDVIKIENVLDLTWIVLTWHPTPPCRSTLQWSVT
jgi:hypothetical protein